MKMLNEIPETFLAPCGINCLACYVHLREKKPCQGCRGQDESKPEHCRKCKIKTCAAAHEVDFCGDCADFPCVLIKRLDRSYRTRYQMSLIENARQLKTRGAEAFLLAEKERWTCQHCGGIVSLHDRICSGCGRGI